jgi:hypothetical protein
MHERINSIVICLLSIGLCFSAFVNYRQAKTQNDINEQFLANMERTAKLDDSLVNEQTSIRQTLRILILTAEENETRLAALKHAMEKGPVNVQVPIGPNNSPWSDKALKKFRDDWDAMIFQNEANKKAADDAKRANDKKLAEQLERDIEKTKRALQVP